MKLNLRKFKKIAQDEHTTTMLAPEGHEIKISHKNLHPATRGQLAALPMASGGKVDPTQAHEYSGDKLPQQAEKAAVGMTKMAGGGLAMDPQPEESGDLVDKAANFGKAILDKADANLKENYDRNVAASKGDLAAQHEVAQNSLGASMGSLEAVPGAGDVEAMRATEMEAAQANNALKVEQAAKNRNLWRQEQNALDLKAAKARKLGGKFADGGEVADTSSQTPALDQLAGSIQRDNPGMSYGDAVTKAALAQQKTSNNIQAQKSADAQQQAQDAAAATLPTELSGPLGITPEVSPPADNSQQSVAPQGVTPGAPQQASQAMEQPQTPQQAPDPYGTAQTQAAFNLGLQSTMAGNEKEAAVAQNLGAAQAATLGKQVGIQAQQQTDYQNHFKALDMERQALQADIQNNHIDPNRFINTMDGASRIATAIGLIASGMGSAMAHQSNLAADFLHKQIDNDINAQKANLGKQENLLSANMRQFGNLRDATDMTRIMQTDILANKLKLEAAKASGPMAQANLLKASGDLLMKNAGTMGQMAMRQSLLSGMAKGRVAPESVIMAIVPKEEQAGATKELKEAQNAVSLRDNTLSDFDKIAKINTIGNRAAHPIDATRQVNAIRGAALDKLTKDISGRVTPETVHLIGGIFDTLGTDAPTQAIQRQKLNELMSQGMHFPELKKWGIDPTNLGRFDQQGQSRIKLGPPKR